MNRKNKFWLTAGFLNLLTAFVHTVAGQIDLVHPLLSTDMNLQAKSEWMGAWHMITIMLFLTSYYLLKNGSGMNQKMDLSNIKLIGILYCLISVPFIVSSFYFKTFAPQWIILLPIGILSIIGAQTSTLRR